MLHWIAAARARLIPRAVLPDALMVDVGCGAGLLAPHVQGLGYRHVGVDLTMSALMQAGEHGVAMVRGDAASLPIANDVADVVCAGEILEHVVDLRTTVAEICRILRPGGTVVIDTIAATALARFVAITVAERVPGGAPRGLHDPDLFVDRRDLRGLFDAHGVDLQIRGLRPSIPQAVSWLANRRPDVRMVPTVSTAVLFQGVGQKVSR